MPRQDRTDPRRSPRSRRARSALSLLVALPLAAIGLALSPSGAPATAQTLLAGTALVANWGSNSVTPINTETDTAGSPIAVGSEPDAIAISPDGEMAYVANWGSNSVTPIDLATGAPERAIAVGLRPDAIAITPDGTTAYVADFGSSSVTPINLAKGAADKAIVLNPLSAAYPNDHPDAIAVNPLGDLVYVMSQNLGLASTIYVSSNTVDNANAAAPGVDPTSFTISPDGTTGYATNESRDTVTPIDMATGAAGAPIGVGVFPRDVAFSPDGSTAYVSNFGGDSIRAIGVTERRTGAPVAVGTAPMGLALTPDGSMLYVADSGSNTVTPVTTATESPGTPIAVGTAPDAIAITPGWTDQSFVTWTGGQASTDLGPAFVYYHGSLYAIWTDATSGDEVFYSSFDGTSWAPAAQIAWKGGAALSSAAPSAVVDGSTLYVAWKGDQTGVASVWYSSFNGTNWAPQVRLSWKSGQYAETLDAPAIGMLGVGTGDPVVGWTGGNDEIELPYASGINKWTAPVQATGADGPVRTPYSPALTYAADPASMVVGWTNANGTVGYLPLADVAAQGSVPSALSSAAPAFASDGNAIYVAWRGQTSSIIGYSGSWPGYTKWGAWAPQEFEPQALTGAGPSLAVTGFTVTLGWKGQSSESLGFASANTPY